MRVRVGARVTVRVGFNLMVRVMVRVRVGVRGGVLLSQPGWPVVRVRVSVSVTVRVSVRVRVKIKVSPPSGQYPASACGTHAQRPSDPRHPSRLEPRTPLGRC